MGVRRRNRDDWPLTANRTATCWSAPALLAMGSTLAGPLSQPHSDCSVHRVAQAPAIHRQSPRSPCVAATSHDTTRVVAGRSTAGTIF